MINMGSTAIFLDHEICLVKLWLECLVTFVTVKKIMLLISKTNNQVLSVDIIFGTWNVCQIIGW